MISRILLFSLINLAVFTYISILFKHQKISNLVLGFLSHCHKDLSLGLYDELWFFVKLLLRARILAVYKAETDAISYPSVRKSRGVTVIVLVWTDTYVKCINSLDCQDYFDSLQRYRDVPLEGSSPGKTASRQGDAVLRAQENYPLKGPVYPFSRIVKVLTIKNLCALVSIMFLTYF